MSLPDGINYSAQKMDSAVVDSQLVEIQPMNGRSFSCQSQLILELPNRPFSFYDLESSTLSMNITNGDGAAVAFDSTLASLINRMQITNAGSVLSDVVDYNKVHAFMMDYQTSREERTTRLAITSGNAVPIDTCVIPGTPARAVVAANAAGPAIDAVANLTQTIVKGSARLGESIAAGATKNFSTQLIGSIFSSNKYINAGLASPLTINLFLEEAGKAFKGTNGLVDADITITDVKLQFQSIRVEPGVYNQIASQGFTYQCEDYATSRSTIEQSATAHTITLPFRYSKLKSVYHLFFKQANLVDGTAKSQTGRVGITDLNFKEYYLNIAGSKFPAMNVAEFNVFEKLMQSLGVSGYDSHQISVSDVEAKGEAFAVGLDLEAVRNKGDTLMSGASTIDSSVAPVFTFSAARENDPGVVAVIHVASYDSLIQMDPATRLLVLST